MNNLVQFIIEWTAAKVGGYSYADDAVHLNGTWNEEMGYGRIDMYRALRFARDNYTNYKFEHVSRDYALAVGILFGLTSGGGVVLPPGGAAGAGRSGIRNRQSAGDDGRGATMPLINHFQQIAP